MGEPFQRMRPDARRRKHDAVRPYRGGWQRAASLRSTGQVSHPCLDVPVEALLGLPAEQKETQADNGVSMGAGREYPATPPPVLSSGS